MGNQLSQALASAGLVSQKAVDNKIAQESKQNLRRQRKEQQRRFLETDEGEIENISSPADFMERARQRLKNEGYSRELMNTIFREAHQFADAKLTKRKRSRLHWFLCQIQERLESASEREREVILRDGKKAFQAMNMNKL